MAELASELKSAEKEFELSQSKWVESAADLIFSLFTVNTAKIA